MNEISERFRKVAGQFTARVASVPEGAWNNPAPCDGWVARDVVRHLVEWMPSLFLEGWSLEQPVTPSVEEDPVGAWTIVCDAIQTALDDPAIAPLEADIRPGRFAFAQAVDMFGTPDVLVHTWDLARAAGLDETLDPDEVRRLFKDMEPYDEVLRQSGQYGPRVPVPDDADEQTKLIAFTGRRP